MFPKNSGISKSSNSIGFSIINHPFWGTPIFGKHPYAFRKTRFLSVENDVPPSSFWFTNTTFGLSDMVTCEISNSTTSERFKHWSHWISNNLHHTNKTYTPHKTQTKTDQNDQKQQTHRFNIEKITILRLVNNAWQAHMANLGGSIKIFRFAPKKPWCLTPTYPWDIHQTLNHLFIVWNSFHICILGVPGVCLLQGSVEIFLDVWKQKTSSYLGIFLWDALSTCWLVTTRMIP